MKYVTVPELAKQLGITRRQIYYAVSVGKIIAQNQWGRFAFAPSAVNHARKLFSTKGTK
jgi:hypothetical protein